MPAGAMDSVELFVVARGAPETIIDLGEKGPSAGDMNIWSQPVFDGREKEQVGTSSGYCVRVSATEPVLQCSFTLALKEGSVFISSSRKGKTGPFNGAVTGGTGEYAGARGEVKYYPNEDFTKWSYSARLTK